MVVYNTNYTPEMWLVQYVTCSAVHGTFAIHFQAVLSAPPKNEPLIKRIDRFLQISIHPQGGTFLKKPQLPPGGDFSSPPCRKKHGVASPAGQALAHMAEP